MTVIGESELKHFVRDAIRKTINKFREYPFLFFTESDIHSYFYRCLYGKRLEVKTKDGFLTSCLHREYPTNFRFDKKIMTDHGLAKVADRGHFDMAVLNPEFIKENHIRNVINKNVRDVEVRSRDKEKFRKEIIAAIEFKYVINNRKDFITEFEKDVTKLSLGRKYQDFEAYSLVFCNHEYSYSDELREKVRGSSLDVASILAVSYFEGPKKLTPKILTNQRIDFL